MIYDILDFLEELFWKVRAYYRKRKSIVISIFIFIISIYAGSLIYFLKDERIRLVKENRGEYDFWYVHEFDFKRKLYAMNYGFSLNETVRLYNFNFKRHLVGWKWKIGSKDVFYVFILPYNRKYFYVPERQILYLKKADYSKEFEKEAIDYKNIGKFLEVKLVEDEKDRKIRKFLKFLEENN